MTPAEDLATYLAKRFLGVAGWTWEDVAREADAWWHSQANRPASARQLDVLRVFAQRAPELPTLQELADGVGMSSTNVVYPHVRALVRQGLLSAGPKHTSRRYWLTRAGRKAVTHDT